MFKKYIFRTGFKHIPCILGKEIDLYLLYWLVTSQGGGGKASFMLETNLSLKVQKNRKGAKENRERVQENSQRVKRK